MSDYEHVRLEWDEDGDVAVLTLARPERRNALGSAAAREVGQAVHEAAAARVLILTGDGGAFCAGGDLGELAEWSSLPEDEIGGTLYETFQGMIRAIRASDSVVIAAIPGAAVGAGMDLALACDLRVAGKGARLGQVWVRLGVIPGTGGAWLTQALAGPTVAADLLLTGRLVDADEALAAGLVNRVVPDERLMEETRSLASEVLRHPRDGVVANKRAMIRATEAQVEAALQHAAEVQPGRFTSEEFKEALGRARG